MRRDGGKIFQNEDGAKRGRIEVRIVVIGVLVVILLGGLYVALYGSPASHRATLDSNNTNPYPPTSQQHATDRPAH
jgi:hypothetical protein